MLHKDQLKEDGVFTEVRFYGCVSKITRLQITIIRLVSTTRIYAYVTPTTDIDHSCHIKAIELIQPIVWGLYYTTSRH